MSNSNNVQIVARETDHNKRIFLEIILKMTRTQLIREVIYMIYLAFFAISKLLVERKPTFVPLYLYSLFFYILILVLTIIYRGFFACL